MILHLGVIDVPYAEAGMFEKYQDKLSRAMGEHGTIRTTGDVAEILEEKYHVMGIFADFREEDIAKAMEDGLAGALENLMLEAPPTDTPFADGESKVDEMFKDFLSSREIEYLSGLAGGTTGISPIPTKAALHGVNHRLKHPYARGNPRRPSFIDTGLYQSSFRAWVDDQASE